MFNEGDSHVISASPVTDEILSVVMAVVLIQVVFPLMSRPAVLQVGDAQGPSGSGLSVGGFSELGLHAGLK